MTKIWLAIKNLTIVIKKYLGYLFFIILFCSFFVSLVWVGNFAYDYYMNHEEMNSISSNSEPDVNESYDTECNVAGINLHGQLVTYIPEKDSEDYVDTVPADYVSYYIKKAEKNSDIKAIVLEIDSPGGSPVAGEEIAHLLKTSKKPTIALIRQAGLSASYWAASGANTIFASRNSDVGSIGVTYSYLDNVEKNQKEGLNYNLLYSGKYKEMASRDKVLTEEERNLIMRDLKIIHNNFIADVAKNRKLTVGKVTIIADGSSVLGEQAKNLGLVDQIGDLVDVEAYLEKTLGDKVEICWN